MRLTPLEFMNLLTEQEQTIIAGAGLQSPVLHLWLLRLAAADTVDPTHPQLAEGITAMVQAGVLSQERADEIAAAVADPPRPPAPTVVSSSAEVGVPQIDQRFYVTEIFTLSDGSIITQVMFCDAGTDYQALLARHAAELNADLAQRGGNG